jgi:hypothetical protein
MVASVADKVFALVDAAFTATNNALPSGSPEKVTGYNAIIPGVPTNRYWVMFCGEPLRGNSTVDGLSRDANGRFQITVAATRPDSLASPAPRTGWLARVVLNALVDVAVTDVDGLGPFVIQQDEVDTYPTPVEVVQDRVTVEHALLFRYIADRI